MTKHVAVEIDIDSDVLEYLKEIARQADVSLDETVSVILALQLNKKTKPDTSKVYKIMDENGLFSSGGNDMSKYNAHGKIWSKKQHVDAHCKMLHRTHDSSALNRTKLYMIEYELVESSKKQIIFDDVVYYAL